MYSTSLSLAPLAAGAAPGSAGSAPLAASVFSWAAAVPAGTAAALSAAAPSAVLLLRSPCTRRSTEVKLKHHRRQGNTRGGSFCLPKGSCHLDGQDGFLLVWQPIEIEVART